ncbi:MAG TPA: 1,4-beta-xylanase, partial [Cellvibrio sp.]
MKLTTIGKSVATALTCAAALYATSASAQTLTANSTGTNNGFYYTFWKDSGDASMGLQAAGRYTSQWTNSTNNWVGG